VSIAAWKGFTQLFYRPFYWEKTVHGLDEGSG
jgi:glycosyltransferase XagB